MNWLNKLERKFGRYAVPNLIVYLIGAYSVGFVLNMVAPNILGFLNFQPYYILHGQIWRLITWILMPTDSNIIFLLIMMMFYYQLGTALERAWGTFRFNAYAYGDKYMKKTLRMGDLLHLDDAVKKRLVTMVDSKNLVMEGSYNASPISVDEMWNWLEKYAAIFKDYICDVGQYLADADAAGKKVLFEAQLGALRDIDFGIYPYTTSSNVIGAYAPIGAGIPGHKLHNSIGVMKAYSSCVGDGPFAAELAMTEEEKHALREAGHEYGAATGRPRRVGPIDLVASRYGVFCQGCDEVALTLLDVLDYMEKIPMVTAYKLADGTTTTRFPMGEALDTAQPVVEYLPGWHCDITAARKWEDLPQQARDYVEYLEKAVGCKITYISVGAEREAYIHRV